MLDVRPLNLGMKGENEGIQPATSCAIAKKEGKRAFGRFENLFTRPDPTQSVTFRTALDPTGFQPRVGQ